jgi:hypothetical protein
MCGRRRIYNINIGLNQLAQVWTATSQIGLPDHVQWCAIAGPHSRSGCAKIGKIRQPAWLRSPPKWEKDQTGPDFKTLGAGAAFSAKMSCLATAVAEIKLLPLRGFFIRERGLPLECSGRDLVRVIGEFQRPNGTTLKWKSRLGGRWLISPDDIIGVEEISAT